MDKTEVLDAVKEVIDAHDETDNLGFFFMIAGDEKTSTSSNEINGFLVFAKIVDILTELSDQNDIEQLRELMR